MNKYRDRLQIIADILSTVSGRARKTQIMYQANLSYKLLCRYLDEVLDAGLVSVENGDQYVLTAKGKEFITYHDEYSKHCKSLEEQSTYASAAKTSLEKMCSSEFRFANSDRIATRRTVSNNRSPAVRGVVLAAGEGTRIRKVTYGAFPKELLPIGNVPTIRFPIEALRLAGIEDIFVVIAPQTKHGIIDGLQSGEKFGVNISYVVQEKNEKGPSGMGHAILSARSRMRQDEDFVVACGDTILCDVSGDNPLDCLKPLIRVHNSTDAIATVMVHPTNADPTRFGVVKFRSFHEENGALYGELDKLVEKPSLELAQSFRLNGFHYIAVGYYAFNPRIFSYIERTKPGARNEVQITDSIALALQSGEKVVAVVHAKNRGKDIVPCEYWDVGIPEDYMEANKRLFDMNLDRLVG